MKNSINYINEHYPLYKNGTSNRYIRHDFFKEIKTNLLAYLLGFIYSDGCINDQRHTLRIHINNKDAELFDLFKVISPDAYTLEIEGYTSTKAIRNNIVKNDGSIALQISSKILIGDLHKLGVCERKTYENLHIPNMDKLFIPSFIRGYFDGDGCFTWHAAKPNPKNRQINWTIKQCWLIESKTETLLKEFQEYFNNNNIKVNMNFLKRDLMFRLTTASKKEFLKIYELIYKNANFGLSRKLNKINHYVNTEVTLLITEYRNALEMSVIDSNNSPKSVEHSNMNENVR